MHFHALTRIAAPVLLGFTALAAQDATQELNNPEKIAWFGTLESARQEAARTNRPIFLLAARPCASGVPGFW